MESQAHIDLVNVALQYIKTIIPAENHELIQMDSAGSNSAMKIIGNYVPDIYYKYDKNLIIGEAKTINDFERVHSQNQFDAYINESELFRGESLIVVSVPWQLVSTAKNYFRRIKCSKNVQTRFVVINEIGRCFEV